MKKFIVTITETNERDVEVFAKDYDDAFDKISDAYVNLDIVLNDNDFVEFNLKVSEAPEVAGYELHHDPDTDTFYFIDTETSNRVPATTFYNYDDDELLYLPNNEQVDELVSYNSNPDMPMPIMETRHCRNLEKKYGIINKTGIENLTAHIYSQWAIAQDVSKGFKLSQQGYAKVYESCIHSGDFCCEDMFTLFLDLGLLWKECSATEVLDEHNIEYSPDMSYDDISSLAVEALENSEYSYYEFSYEVDGKEVILISLASDSVPVDYYAA